MSQRQRWGLALLIALWLLASLAGLWSLGQNKLRAFDGQGHLIHATTNPDFEARLTRLVIQQLGTLESKVIHFTQGNCFCHWVAAPHIQSVRELAEEQGYQNLELALSAEWAELIPVSPAVAVFNKLGQLDYLGPYSSGFYCSAGNGIVEPFLTGKKRSAGAFIASDARGCYCPLT